MSFEDYANHISQKLKLAVSVAIIRSVPENTTTEEYIDQLKSNILRKMDLDFEISVCSDDFKLDDSNSDHNLINNNNISDNNNNSDNNTNNNTNLSNNHNEVLINSIKNDNINNDFDNNFIRNNEVDNITLINNEETAAVTRNEENDTNLKINDRKNDYIGISEEYNDILTNDNKISLANEDYDDLIDEVLQLDESQTIFHNFCVETKNPDKDTNFNKNKDTNMKCREEILTQDTSNATQTIDFTKSLDFNEETYCESVKDISTEKATKIYQEISNSDTKMNEDNRGLIKDVNNIRKSTLKHNINIEERPSPKRRKNVDTDPKFQIDRQIEDPNSRIKDNISKFLDKNNIAKVVTQNIKVKDSFETPNKKLDQNSTECTQTNTYYSQSQPLLVIDKKYIYDKSKTIPRIEKGLNIDTELTKKDLSITTNDTNTPKVNKDHDIADENSITNETAQDTALEVPNYSTNIMKIIENDTAFHFEREVIQFSQTTVCDTRNEDITESNDNKNKNNVTIIEAINNRKEATNAITFDTTDDRNNSDRESTIDLTQYSINLTEGQFTQIYENNKNRHRDDSHRSNNSETVQSTIMYFSQQSQDNNNRTIDNNNRNIDNNNKNREHTNRNNDDNEPTQSTADVFSQENNNNRNIDNNNRNRNNNKTTMQSTDLTRNTLNNLPIENFNRNDEIINQSRNSDTDLTDSDEVQTEEVIPFKIVEELNKVKIYLNKIGASDSSSDTGYKTDSQSRHSLKMSQSIIWLNQSAHSLFTYISSCQLISNTEEITKEISVVLSQLIQKLHEEEKYLSFMEEMLDTVDLLLHSVLDENMGENECLKKDETMQRILLLNKSIHIQTYTIDKITYILENIHTNLTTKNTYETENIEKIENSCYIFHLLHIILQRYHKNKENLTKKQESSQKSQCSSQKSQCSSQKSQCSSQKSQYSSQNSQEMLKKTDISEIWKKKWNPNFKEDKNKELVEKKCALTDCSKVLNKLIVSCMDGYSLIAYFALKCFNIMQSK